MGEAETLELPITKMQWGLRGAQIFFAFLSMSCIAAEIAFDNKFMSSSIISNIHLFIVVLSIFVAAATVGIPYAYLTYGKLQSAARALRIPRIEFVHTAIWSVLLFIVSLALSLELGFRDCDPYSPKWTRLNATYRNDTTFINGLQGNCRTARAGLAFGWFALGAWLFSLAVIGKEWYDSRRQPLPKHDPHKDEVTMNTNSSRSSFEPAGEHRTQQPYQEQVQMQNSTSQPYSQQVPTSQPYSHQTSQPFSHQVPYSTPQQSYSPMPGVTSQHASPIMTPTGFPIPEPQPPIPTAPTGPGVGFPQPQYYPPPQG
ncbi:10001_t:CDS:1 [Racocetra persica]|uniref:10001_t:CDS:1 n=1 Tax=Racocetra persica TaxID=160502 RepID=A0ACA9PTX7_9GLOM|nr:10001_t:CDS:1 [Racocetra persica]